MKNDTFSNFKFLPNADKFLAKSRFDNNLYLLDVSSGKSIYSFGQRELVSIMPKGQKLILSDSEFTEADIIYLHSIIDADKAKDKVLAASSKAIASCLTPNQRELYSLPPNPPCWCQEKNYPTLKMWEDDYLSRHPELDNSSEDGNWPKGKVKPNPFTHERDDGWTCPPAGEGYSAPWNDYPDLKALTASEILGPADEAFARLEELGISTE